LAIREAAVLWIELRQQSISCAGQPRVGLDRRCRATGHRRLHATHRRHHVFSDAKRLSAIGSPYPIDGCENGGKSRSGRGIVAGREVASCIEWFQVRRKKQVVWPSAAVRHHLPRNYVNSVDVRALFAIDFHVDEPLVH
jgi:hypothetical protein